MKQSGIYRIVNVVADRVYVGSAIVLDRRRKEHWNHLKAGRHPNTSIQVDWYEFGPQAFSFEVVEVVDDPQTLLEREQAHIDEELASGRGRLYNICLVAGSRLGTEHSVASRALMSRKALGRLLTAETRAKMSATKKGRKQTPEHRANYVASRRAKGGFQHKPESLARISATMAAKPRTPEWNAAISAGLKGKPKSEAHRLAMREVRRSLTQTQVDDILARRTAGETYVAIAQDYGTTKDTVRNWCRRFGEPLQNVYTTPDREAEMIRRHQAGETNAAIAASLGLSETTVWRKVRKWRAAQPQETQETQAA